MKLLAPLINDISTDTADPPLFSDSASGLADRVVAATRKHYSNLGPVHLADDPAAGFRKVLEAAELMPRWKLSVIDRENQSLEGYAVSGLFRFRDDFVIRVQPDGTGSKIDMRSRSRAGKGDFGANASRIAAFCSCLRKTAGS